MKDWKHWLVVAACLVGMTVDAAVFTNICINALARRVAGELRSK